MKRHHLEAKVNKMVVHRRGYAHLIIQGEDQRRKCSTDLELAIRLIHLILAIIQSMFDSITILIDPLIIFTYRLKGWGFWTRVSQWGWNKSGFRSRLVKTCEHWS